MIRKDKQKSTGQEFITRHGLRRHVSCSTLGAIGALLTTIVPFQAMAAPVTINITDKEIAKSVTINVGGQTVMDGTGHGGVINLLDSSIKDGVVINIGDTTHKTTPRVTASTMLSRAVVETATKQPKVAVDAPVVASVDKKPKVAVGIPAVAPVVKPTGITKPTSTIMDVPTVPYMPPVTSANDRSRGDYTVVTPSQSSTASGDMRRQFNELAPTWVQDTLQALARDGHLGATRESDVTGSITRKEGALLAARAYNLAHRQVTSSTGTELSTSINLETSQRIEALMDEFMPELQALGYGSETYVATTKYERKRATKPSISGEVRYSYMHNTGDSGNKYDKNRWRMRLYGKQQLTSHWTVYGLVEFVHSSLSGVDADTGRQSDESSGKLHLSRFYAEGKYNWFDIPFTVNAGRTYAYLASGTVMDSDLKGVAITAQPTMNLSISAGQGKVNSTQNLTFVEGTQRRGLMDYMAGYYHWNHYGSPVTILYGGLNYYVDNYTLTGQYLNANKPDGSGAKDGYQVTVKYGKNFPWIAHTYEFNVDYYDLAGTTYINHTMNGLGGRMNGFTGWGSRFYYSLRPDLMVSLQYYDLKDKTTKQKGRTLWGEINWGF